MNKSFIVKSILLTLLISLSTSSVHAFSLRSLFGGGKETGREQGNQEQGVDEIRKQLDQSIDEAKVSLGGKDSAMTSLLNQIQSEAASGEDLAMLKSLPALLGSSDAMASMMTGDQKSMLLEVKAHGQALALKRSFSDDPSLQGPVTQAVNAIQKKDALAAASSLKSISDHATMTPLQRQVIGSLMGEYGQYLDRAGKAMDSINSVSGLLSGQK